MDAADVASHASTGVDASCRLEPVLVAHSHQVRRVVVGEDDWVWASGLHRDFPKGRAGRTIVVVAVAAES